MNPSESSSSLNVFCWQLPDFNLQFTAALTNTSGVVQDAEEKAETSGGCLEACPSGEVLQRRHLLVVFTLHV